MDVFHSELYILSAVFTIFYRGFQIQLILSMQYLLLLDYCKIQLHCTSSTVNLLIDCLIACLLEIFSI